MPRNPECTACGLCESTKNVCVWGDGEGEGFLIGEAPGQAEARTGKPFMGQAGQLLRPILEEYGIEDPYITNVAKCRPPGNRKPEPSEIKACKPYLLEEIETRKPKAILLLGATAMKAMIGKTGITQMNGQIVEKDGIKYVCSFHPAYILRDPTKEGQMRVALSRYAQVLKGEFKEEMPPWKAVEKSTIDQFLADWDLCDNFTFDTESAGDGEGEGLDWWKDGFQMYSIAFTFTDADRTWERTWGLSTGAPAVLPFEAEKELIEYMVATQGKKKLCGGHNVKWDNKVIRRMYGVSFRADDDSQLLHHLVDEESTHKLKPLARQYLAAPDYDLTLKEKKQINLVPVRRRLTYNCGDSAYTDRLIPLFKKRLNADELWLYNRVVMCASRAFEQIEMGGLYVDVEYLNRSSDQEYKKLKEVEAELDEMAGRHINWGSRDQVAEVLFKDLELTPTVLTPTGKPSTAEDALVDIEHPIGKLIERRRGHDKFLSTYAGFPPNTDRNETPNYAGGWRDFMDGPHLYLSTKIHGTVTGRYSSRLHQTPRDGTIRNAVTAPPGWTHGQLDLSQAELRVIAILSRDPEMLRCFRTGEDIHWRTLIEAVRAGGGDALDLVVSTAEKITGRKRVGKKLNRTMNVEEAIDIVYDYGKFDPDKAIAIEKDWKEWRKKAKGINFGFCFDQSPQGFVGYAKAKYGFEPTLEEATIFHASYFNLYRALPPWHNRQRELARQDGFVRAMSGRTRHLPGIFSSDRSVRAEAERQAINSPVQGFIGDYKAMILCDLADHPKLTYDRFRLKGEVHDSILFWVKNEYVDEVMPRLWETATNPPRARECGLKFPIEMSIEVELGRWGDGEKWKP